MDPKLSGSDASRLFPVLHHVASSKFYKSWQAPLPRELHQCPSPQLKQVLPLPTSLKRLSLLLPCLPGPYPNIVIIAVGFLSFPVQTELEDGWDRGVARVQHHGSLKFGCAPFHKCHVVEIGVPSKSHLHNVFGEMQLLEVTTDKKRVNCWLF